MIIDHVGIVTSDYARAKEFYAAALASIGGKLHMEFPQPNHDVSGWGRETPDFWVSTCPDKTKPTPVHVAFACDNRAQVDAFYEAALKAGATDNGKPGVRAQYHPNYYGAFVKDFDGHGIEAVCHKPQA